MIRCMILVLAFAPSAFAQNETPKPPLGSFKLRPLGPALTSGRIVGFAVHPQDRATYYVAVASGGVWKTVNSGTTWTPVFDGEGSYSIGCVVLDPKNPNVVWVGTGENNSQRSVAYGDGVYKSLDAGRTWTNVGLKQSEHIGRIIIDPRDSDIVYVAAQGSLWGPGGDRGLYRTKDGGRNWSKILDIDDNTGVTDVIQHPTQPDILVAASYQRRRHVWTLVNGGPGSAIHRSSDGGRNWKKVSGLPGAELGRIGLAYAPSEPDTAYAIIEAADRMGGIFRSTDKGITWEKRNPFDSQAQYYSHLVVDPSDKNRLFAMNVIIQVSDDGGTTLKPQTERFKHVDNHALWIDPKNPNYYLCGCDGGVYESFDRGANWHFKSNLPVTQFYDVGVDQNPASGPFYHVYGGTQDNYTLGGPVRTRSVHGITNGDWYVVQAGDGFHCTVDPTDANIVYGESQYGGLVRYDRRTGNSVDIQPQARSGEPPLRWNWDSPLLLSPHNPKRLYFAANRVFRSDDRGNSWTPVSDDLTRQLDRDKLPVFGRIQSADAVAKHVSTSFYGNIVALTESPKTEGLLYAGTDDGLICVTEDGGRNWRRFEAFPGVPDNTYVSKLVASQHDAKTLYAAFDNHKNADFKPYLLKSTDAGRNWISITGDLPERGGVYCLAEDHVNSNLLFCGTEFALYVTTDGGKAWHRLKNGLPTILVKDLVIQRANDDLVVGTFGRGIYLLDDYSALRSLTPEALAKDAFLAPVRGAIAYVPNAQYGARGKANQGESFFTADNPPFGATITVNVKEVPKSLKAKRKEAEKVAAMGKKPLPVPTPEQLRAEAEEEAVTFALEIRDSGGEVIRRVSVSPTAGVHRVTWNLREAGPGGVDDGFGPLVVPGEYSMKLVKRTTSRSEYLGNEVSLTVMPDPFSKLTAAEYKEIIAFNQRIRTLRRSLTAAGSSASELNAQLEAMKKVIDAAAKEDAKLKAEVRALLEGLKRIDRDMHGDSFLRGRNENIPMSIAERVSFAARATSDSVAAPTGTMKEQASDAEKLLKEQVVKLKKIAADARSMSDRLDKSGYPWTPGRLPK